MSFNKKTIRDIDISGKTVLVRTDYNVELNSKGQVVDDYRIRMTLPTIEYLIGQGSKVVILSHLGRPGGKKDLKHSLMPVASKLSDLLHLQVRFVPDVTAKAAKNMIDGMQPGSVAVLENLRFWPGEEANDEEFAKLLASFGDVFVQEGFAVAYREHSSVVGLTKHLPAVAGLLLEKEMLNLENRLNEPEKPLALIVGGVKVADKLPVIEQFLEKSDFIAVGGVVGNTFLKAAGYHLGSSLVESDYLDKAKEILEKATEISKQRCFTFLLPKDVVAAKSDKYVEPVRVVDLNQHTWADITAYPKIPKPTSFELTKTDKILDIGPMTAATISGSLKLCSTAVWCGPLGSCEIKGFNQCEPPFSHGSRIVAEAMVGENAGYQNKPYSIAGGGNTLAMLDRFGLLEQFDFLSTGGGACLKVLAGEKLAGVEVLVNKDGN